MSQSQLYCLSLSIKLYTNLIRATGRGPAGDKLSRADDHKRKAGSGDDRAGDKGEDMVYDREDGRDGGSR